MAELIISLAGPVVEIAINRLQSLADEFSHIKDDVQNLNNSFREIQDYLKVLEGSHQMNTSTPPSLNNWFERVRAAAYDAEDLIDYWTTECDQWKMKKQVQKFQLPFCTFKFLFLHRDLSTLREITSRIDKIKKDYETARRIHESTTSSHSNPRETSSVPNMSAISRVAEEQNIKKLLITDEETSNEEKFSFIAIVGMGGLGKTTLAQLVFNDVEVDGHFDFRIWVFVGENFDRNEIFKNVLVSLRLSIIRKKESNRNSSSLNQQQINSDVNSLSLEHLQNNVKDILTEKRFLLVLDDLWNCEDEGLEPLVNVLNLGAKGSRVLVTSRNKEVSNIRRSKSPHKLSHLRDDESWSLFENLAFKGARNLDASEHAEFEKYGREIVGKCHGLPLALKQMAGLLRGQNLGEWIKIAKSQTWKAQPEAQKGVFDVLRLSYNHLPSSEHQQCFAFCSMFPKAYLYEKDELVKLWMAEAFIQQPESGERTEDAGSRYFEELSDRFFFESSIEDNTKFRMHDLVHDVAQSVSSPFCCQVKDEKDINEKSRHVSLLTKQLQKPALEILSKSKKLRTLLFPAQHLQWRALGNAQKIRSLDYMRVLDLSSSTLLTLPDSVGRLKLLHYLDLSRTEIQNLPDSICNLYNLETLKLLHCPWLFSLPKGLKYLVKLRHLELDEMFWYKVTTLPRSMGRLTSLHNLHKFQVGCNSGYKLEELENMAYLGGTLHISKLENAVNAGNANLKGKERIEKVVYEWSSNRSHLNLQDEETEKQVLEDLEPNPNVLKDLQICDYMGTDFPDWMKRGRLENLVNVYLKDCRRIKILNLCGLHKLKKLRLKNMLELEEWPVQSEGLINVQISNCPKLNNPLHFPPSLRFLKIKKCKVLDTILLTVTPTDIILVDNPLLKHLSTADNFKFFSFIKLKIFNCPQLHVWPKVLNDLFNMEIMGDWEFLDSACNVRYGLQHLALDACHEKPLLCAMSRFKRLQSLVISNISNLICLIRTSLPQLRALYICDCKDLQYLSDLEDKLFQDYTSLTTLSIHNCPKLVTLPVEGLPTSLEYLTISSCTGLQSFGPADVLQKLDSLHDIYIEDCPALQSLPEGGLSKSLLHLSIQHCPLLIEQCGKEDGDLPKIKDIPDLEIGTPSTKTATSSSSSSAASYHLPWSFACGGK